jgi:hypothetical protein
LSLKTKVYDLLVVCPQNHWDGFLWFGLKTGGDGFLQFSLKTGGDGFLQFGMKTGGDGFLWFGLKTSGDGFLRFGLKAGGDGYLGLASKPVVGFLIEPQNQCGGGFSSLGLKIGIYDLVICASKSPRWFFGLGLKTMQSTVCWLCHKTYERVTV